MDNLINAIDSIFYIDYSIVTIISVYFTIKVLTEICPNLITTSNRKKLITFIVSISTAIIFHYCFGDECKKLLVSAFLSIIAYDYLIKQLLTKLNIK